MPGVLLIRTRLVVEHCSIVAMSRVVGRGLYVMDQELNELAGVSRFFEERAAFWEDVYDADTLDGAIYRQRLEVAVHWVRELGLPAGSSVLDVGCGAGFLMVPLAQLGFLTVGMDVSMAMLEVARGRVQSLPGVGEGFVALADTASLGFRTGSFDLISALGVIPWIKDPIRALEELGRALTPNGYLLATSDNSWRLAHVLDPRHAPYSEGIRRGIRLCLLKLTARATSPRVRERRYSSQQVDQIFAAAGFEVVKRTHVGYGPFTLVGRRVLSENASIRLNVLLHKPGFARRLLRAGGNHYIVLARPRRA